MSESMLERVARALSASHYPDKDPDGMWRHMIPDARAALVAMRELTSEIHAAMVKECGADARGAWSAGIDAALEGK